MKIEWTLNEAWDLIGILEPQLRALNYYSALTGSVLHKGLSYNDVDIMIHPLYNDKPHSYNKLMDMLWTVFNAVVKLQTVEEYESESSRVILKGVFNNKKVDFFIYPVRATFGQELTE